jgi:hypothetical protein
VKLALSDLQGEPDGLLCRTALSVIALGRGNLKLGAPLNYAEDDEIATYVEDHLAWSLIYKDDVADVEPIEIPKSGH